MTVHVFSSEALAESGGPEPAVVRESAAVDDEVVTWPSDKLSALRLGRRLVAEVPAAPGRRAFVDITPVSDRPDHVAGEAGWRRSDPQRAFRLSHWDYDERQVDGWDYDVGARQIRADIVPDESSLLELLAEWGLRPAQFRYPWDTADPR